jgi:hypothetical protein
MPTRCPRHVPHALEVVPEFPCNGANQTVLDRAGQKVGHDACAESASVHPADGGLTPPGDEIDASPMPHVIVAATPPASASRAVGLVTRALAGDG